MNGGRGRVFGEGKEADSCGGHTRSFPFGSSNMAADFFLLGWEGRLEFCRMMWKGERGPSLSAKVLHAFSSSLCGLLRTMDYAVGSKNASRAHDALQMHCHALVNHGIALRALSAIETTEELQPYPFPPSVRRR